MTALPSLVLLAALLAGLGAAPQREDPFRPDPTPPSRRYLPIEIWRDAGDAGFHERWFGGQLRAMGEPILSRPGDLAGFSRRFRMLVLPSFHPAYAIRIDVPADGTPRVRIVRLNGAGGYAPGRIAQQESYVLALAPLAELERAIAESRLTALPADGGAYGCADGAGFAFETVDPGGYHFATVHQCDLTPALEALVWRVDALRRTVGSDLDEYRAGPGRSLRPGG